MAAALLQPPLPGAGTAADNGAGAIRTRAAAGVVCEPTLTRYSSDAQVVSAPAIEAAFARFGSAHKQLIALTDSQAPSQHVLAGAILSPIDTPHVQATTLALLASLPHTPYALVETAQRHVKGTGFVRQVTAVNLQQLLNRVATGLRPTLRIEGQGALLGFGQANIQRRPIRDGRIGWGKQQPPFALHQRRPGSA